MNRIGTARKGLLAIAALTLLAGACGRSAPSPTPSVTASGSGNGAPALATTTAPGVAPVDKIVWAQYRETNSLDPIYAFDYPENSMMGILCESLLRQAPDGSIGPGTATLSYTDPTTLVLTLKDGVTFWDGNPVTPDDVVFSIARNSDTDLGGFYPAVFSRVSTVEATGSNQVTISLTEPDYWLPGELASMPGITVEKSYVEAKGADYGTSAGGAMCSGPYKLCRGSPATCYRSCATTAIGTRASSHWCARSTSRAPRT